MKKRLLIFLILIIIVVAIIFFITKNKKEDIKIDDSIYGYLVYKKDDKYNLVELHNDGNNKEITSSEYMFNNITYKHNSLYYYYQDRTDSTTHFMVYTNDKLTELKVEKNGYDTIVDSDEDYVYTSAYDKKITRTNLKSGKEEIISTNPTRELFLHDSRLYVQASSYFYTISINGKNEKKISEQEYKKAKEAVNYQEIEYLYYNQYYIYKDKYIFLKDNQTRIEYDDKEIYKVKEDGRYIILYYTDKEGYLAFIDYFGSGSLEDPKYYIYDLNNDKLEEVTYDDIYEANYIYIK